MVLWTHYAWLSGLYCDGSRLHCISFLTVCLIWTPWAFCWVPGQRRDPVPHTWSGSQSLWNSSGSQHTLGSALENRLLLKVCILIIPRIGCVSNIPVIILAPPIIALKWNGIQNCPSLHSGEPKFVKTRDWPSLKPPNDHWIAPFHATRWDSPWRYRNPSSMLLCA